MFIDNIKKSIFLLFMKQNAFCCFSRYLTGVYSTFFLFNNLYDL